MRDAWSIFLLSVFHVNGRNIWTVACYLCGLDFSICSICILVSRMILYVFLSFSMFTIIGFLGCWLLCLLGVTGCSNSSYCFSIYWEGHSNGCLRLDLCCTSWRAIKASSVQQSNKKLPQCTLGILMYKNPFGSALLIVFF